MSGRNGKGYYSHGNEKSCQDRCAQQISVDRAKAGQQTWGTQFQTQLRNCQIGCPEEGPGIATGWNAFEAAQETISDRH